MSQTNNYLKNMHVIYIGHKCNNRCRMCPDSDLPEKEIPFQETCRNIDRLANKKRHLEFIGGEPSVNKNIEQIVWYARKKGFTSLGITTNGRRLADEAFCMDITKNGLNKINISLHASSAGIHDAIVGKKGAFKEVIRGIDNLKKIPNIQIQIKTVLFKKNIVNILKFKNFIFDYMNIKYWNLSDLIPMEEIPDIKYRKSLLRLKEINIIIRELDVMNTNGKINFFEYPLCIFNTAMKKNPSYNFFRAAEVAGDSEEVFKVRCQICAYCKLRKHCGGYWQKYLNFFGEQEIEGFARENNCLYANA